MTRRKSTLVSAVILLATSASGYLIPRYTINSGGQPATSAGYRLNGSTAQAVQGIGASAGYRGQWGFWLPDLPATPPDAGVLRVIAPTGAFDTLMTIAPSAKVRNFGTSSASFRVFFSIRDAGSASVYARDTLVSGLAAGDSATVGFWDWPMPHAPGNYTARCSTYITGDINSANDTASSRFEVRTSVVNPLWVRVADLLPGAKNKNVKDGGAMAAGKEPTDNDTGYVYAFKGNGRYEFYRYNTLTNAWVAKESIPAFNRNTKKKAVKKGSSLAVAGDGMVYATKGSNSLDWWQYDPLARVWTQKADVPTGTRNCKEGVGSAAVSVGGSDYVYLLRGSGTFDFYRYNAGTDAWETKAPAPGGASGKPFKNGSSICYDGGDTIYGLKGSYNEFAAYSISGNAWVTRDPLPLIAPPGTKKKKVKDGSGTVAVGRTVYALKGGNTNEFWHFPADSHRWIVGIEMPSGAKRVKGGGCLTYSEADSKLYAFRGNNTLETWSYGPLAADGLRLTANSQPKNIQGNSSFVTRHSSLSVAPNPTTSSLNSSISYSLPKAGNISLKLYDVSGKLVAILAGGHRAAGAYSLRLAANSSPQELAAGIYVLRFDSDGYTATEKVIIE
jgi:hypothetical protein